MICVIPARGGSKRIPEKNLKVFEGHPIIGYTIQKAFESELFTEIYVSTDSQSIGTISKQFGAQVIERPANLADDFTPTLDVISHAVGTLELELTSLVCCLYPVTPLLNFSRIFQAVRVIKDEDASYVFPALPLNSQAQRSFECDPGGRISNFENHTLTMRTQDFKKRFTDAGQFYLGKAESWLRQRPIISETSSALMLSPWEVLDVDSTEDWEIMESVYHFRKAKDAKFLKEAK
jgi:pseudaminic acid cytidylyltransferase